MKTREIAEAFLAKINQLDLDGAAAYCAKNFTYSGPFPSPITLQEWRPLARIFHNAFPDWNFNATVEREEGDVAFVTTRITGTQTGMLDLSTLGFGKVQVTHKKISLPKGTGFVSLDGDKVVNFHLNVPKGGGILGMLAQLNPRYAQAAIR